MISLEFHDAPTSRCSGYLGLYWMASNLHLVPTHSSTRALRRFETTRMCILCCNGWLPPDESSASSTGSLTEKDQETGQAAFRSNHLLRRSLASTHRGKSNQINRQHTGRRGRCSVRIAYSQIKPLRILMADNNNDATNIQNNIKLKPSSVAPPKTQSI